MQPLNSAINIILDESETTPDVSFVEIELDDGRSIGIGKRIKYGNYTKIRITANDILNAQIIPLLGITRAELEEMKVAEEKIMEKEDKAKQRWDKWKNQEPDRNQ